jgi:hypothetical protein
MNATRIRTGLAVGILAMGLSSGTAVAQVGCAFSDCTPQSGGGGGGGSSRPRNEALAETVETTTTTSPELAFTDEAPQAEATPELPLTDSAPAQAEGGSLPFTGGDVAGMVLIGAAAVGIGAVMVRRSRTRTAD